MTNGRQFEGWTMFTAVILVVTLFIGIMEYRFRDLHNMVEEHMVNDRENFSGASTRIAVLESQSARTTLDMRNHNVQFEGLRSLLQEHDAATQAELKKK